MQGVSRHYESRDDVAFVWIDIEDHSDLVGELDIETFPTLLVADTQGTLFLGALEPNLQTLARLLQALQSPETRRNAHTTLTQNLLSALPGLPQLHL